MIRNNWIKYLVIYIVHLLLFGCSNRQPEAPPLGEELSRDMAYIPGDCFKLGRIYFHFLSPSKRVCLNGYYIDRTEVTNQQFVAFLNENDLPSEIEKDWLDVESDYIQIHQMGDKWVVDEGYENFPIVEVNWFGAETYCDWEGLRLPTEVEWEYAGSGPNMYDFPWGDAEPSCEYANWQTQCNQGTAAVGSYVFDSSVFGVFDMAGNESEWTSSWYQNSYFSFFTTDNPQGSSEGDDRVIKGGFWSYDHSLPIGYLDIRLHRNPDDPSFVVGFRCALTP